MESNTYGITEVGKMLCVHRSTILRYVYAGIVDCDVDENGRKIFKDKDIAVLRKKMYDIPLDDAIRPTTKRYNLLWKHGGRRYMFSKKRELKQ